MGRRIVIASVAFLAVIAVLAIAARVVFPPEKVRRLVTEQAGRAIGLPVSVERARVSLFPLRLEVEGLRVGNRTPDAPPLAALREANASMKVLPLLSGRIEVSRVRARGLDATLVIEKPAEAPGEGGAAGANGRTDSGSRFALLLSSAEVEEASLRVIDPALGKEYFVDSIALRTSLRAGARGGPLRASGEMRAARARASELAAAGYPDGIGPLAAKFDVEYAAAEGIARIDSLRVTVRNLSLALRGEVNGLPGAPAGALTLATPEIELSDLLSLLPAARATEFEGTGPLAAEGELRFAPGAPPAFRVALILGGLDVRNKRYAGKIENLRGRIEATDKGLSIEDLTASLDGEPIAISGTVTDYADPVVDLSVQGEIDLGALAAAGILPEKTSAGGRVKLDIRAKGPAKRRSDLSLDGTVRIEGVDFAAEKPPVRIAGGRGDVLLSGRRVEAKEIRFDFNGSPSVASAVVLDPLAVPRVSFDLATRKVDLNAFVPVPEDGGKAPPGAGAPIILPPLPPVAASGTVRVDTLLTGANVLVGTSAKVDLGRDGGTIELRLARASFGGVRVRSAGADLRVEPSGETRGTIAADSAIAFRVPLSSLKGRIALTPPAEIRFDDLTGKVYRGSVAGNASVTLGGPDETLYRFVVRAENWEANDFLSNLTPVRDILFGSFSMESEWEGKGLTEEVLLRNLTAGGKANVKGGEIRNLEALGRLSSLLGLRETAGLRFRELWSAFSIADGKLRLDGLEIASADADWNVDGSVGFDGALDYDISVVLSEALSSEYKKKTSLASLFANESGRIVLDLRLTGTAKSPNVTIDASKTASRPSVKSAGDLLQTLGKDEKVKGAIEGLLGGKKNALDGLLGGPKTEKTTADTAAAAAGDTTSPR